MRQHRRRHILIDPFQVSLVIRIAMYCFVYQVAAWALLALFDLVDTAFAEMGVEWQLPSNTLARTLLVMLILVPPLTVDAVRFAHRLVGPLYRLRKTIRAIAAGESVTLVQFRDKDMLVDLKDDFNAMLLYLEQHGGIVLKTPGLPATTTQPQPVDPVAPVPANPGASV